MNQQETAQLERRRNADAPLHGPDAFEGMRRAGRLTAQALDLLVEYVKPGVTTEFLDKLAFDFARDHGAYPAPLLYRGYPKSICTSINHVVCHGIPNDKPLREGDILNIDVTLILDGWHGDSSRMYFVGEVPRRAARLCDITYECLMRGIAAVRPGATTNAIGAAIQAFAEAERCSVVRDFCGHGLDDRGRTVGDDPHLFQVDAERGEEVRDRADVAVLGATREDLVADDEEPRGRDGRHGESVLVAAGGTLI